MTESPKSPNSWKIYWIYLIPLALLIPLVLPLRNLWVDKFYILGEAVRVNKEQQVVRNNDVLNEIIYRSLERGTDDAGKIANDAAAIRKKTQELLKWINDLKEELIRETGGRDEENGGLYKSAAHSVNDLMVGYFGIKNGKGYELKRKLDDWVIFMQKKCPVNYRDKKPAVVIRPLTLKGNEDEYYKRDPNTNSKDFAEINFGKSVPLAAAIAIFENKAYQVTDYEAQVLNVMNPEPACVRVEKLLPAYAALSQVVVAGMEYEASIFICHKGLPPKPKVSFNGNELPIELDGSAKVKFTTSSGNYDKNGMIKKTWTAKVGIPEGWNSYSYQELKGEYYVYKPAITIKADAVNALYEQCANSISIKVPPLGADYKPTFSSNSPFKRGKEIDELVIIPKSKEEVKISVSNKGVFLDSTTFKVLNIPLPRFMVYSNGAPVNLKKGITSKTKNLSLKVLPDEGFAKLLPKESNFAIRKMQVDVYAGSELKNSFTSTNSQIKLPKLKDGDRIVIEIKKLYRTNSLGKKLNVELGNAGMMSVDVID
jgi:gliding motility-associated protein GldM